MRTNLTATKGKEENMRVNVLVCVGACACVGVRVHVCVHTRVCGCLYALRIVSTDKILHFINTLIIISKFNHVERNTDLTDFFTMKNVSSTMLDVCWPSSMASMFTAWKHKLNNNNNNNSDHIYSAISHRQG